MSRPYIRRNIGDLIGPGKAILVKRLDNRLWEMRCVCGTIFKGQPSESKGYCWKCARACQANKMKKHGEAPSASKQATRLYRIWLGMRSRCRNPNNHGYINYGARGISVCSDWDNYETFKMWALENGYADNLSIDRIDVDGDYCPDNCRWATQRVQMNNTRKNHLLTCFGKTQTLQQWSEEMNIPYSALKSRINKYGFSVEEALTIQAKLGNNQTLRKNGGVAV